MGGRVGGAENKIEHNSLNFRAGSPKFCMQVDLDRPKPFPNKKSTKVQKSSYVQSNQMTKYKSKKIQKYKSTKLKLDFFRKLKKIEKIEKKAKNAKKCKNAKNVNSGGKKI